MARRFIPLSDDLLSGELGSIVDAPLYNNGDQVELCLSSDAWSALLERRRVVGWPLCFPEVSHA